MKLIFPAEFTPIVVSLNFLYMRERERDREKLNSFTLYIYIYISKTGECVIVVSFNDPF